ncbi:MAG: hypothetical protein H0T47_17900 [Planctomycetaceae bacterium]|nr:hypothetical protein [Planctomycetaceae bacterium]
MAAATVHCPQCDSRRKIKEKLPARYWRCRKCQTLYKVPHCTVRELRKLKARAADAGEARGYAVKGERIIGRALNDADRAAIERRKELRAAGKIVG